MTQLNTSKSSAGCRSNRMYREDGDWFFKTREGDTVGPFSGGTGSVNAVGNLYSVDKFWPARHRGRFEIAASSAAPKARVIAAHWNFFDVL